MPYGDARELSFLPAGNVDLVVTSPPYWQRRDYGRPEDGGLTQTSQKLWREHYAHRCDLTLEGAMGE
jgi:DNA modification methylase